MFNEFKVIFYFSVTFCIKFDYLLRDFIMIVRGANSLGEIGSSITHQETIINCIITDDVRQSLLQV
jgi:hypothetical protein